jgi:hypothetical protein
VYGRLKPSPCRYSNICGTLNDNRIAGGIFLFGCQLDSGNCWPVAARKVELCKIIDYDHC